MHPSSVETDIRSVITVSTPIGNLDDDDEFSFGQPNPTKNTGEDDIASGTPRWTGPRRDVNFKAIIDQVMRENYANKRASPAAERSAIDRMRSKVFLLARSIGSTNLCHPQ
jgi:hypothetical protein